MRRTITLASTVALEAAMSGLSFDGDGFGSGAARIAWSDLVSVGIRTTADGPWSEDVFWLFLIRDGLVELPGSVIDGEAIGALQTHLPGFDSRKVVVAMGSTDERVFRVWHVEDSRTAWDEPRFAARFEALVARLGGRPSATVFARLHARWAEPFRRYHDLEHLAECLRELDRAGAAPEASDRVELALWYHDAVYAPGRDGDEERSAALLLDDARALELPEETAVRCAELVRATDHRSARDGDPETDLVRDVDVAILASDPVRFLEYEHAIGEEYAHLAHLPFIVGRGRLLDRFLSAQTIYRTPALRDRLEARARANLDALLQSPRYRAWRWLRRWPIGRG